MNINLESIEHLQALQKTGSFFTGDQLIAYLEGQKCLHCDQRATWLPIERGVAYCDRHCPWREDTCQENE